MTMTVGGVDCADGTKITFNTNPTYKNHRDSSSLLTLFSSGSIYASTTDTTNCPLTSFDVFDSDGTSTTNVATYLTMTSATG